LYSPLPQNNAGEEAKLDNPRAENYLLRNQLEGFDDMVRRLEQQKRKFYEKFGKVPEPSNQSNCKHIF